MPIKILFLVILDSMTACSLEAKKGPSLLLRFDPTNQRKPRSPMRNNTLMAAPYWMVINAQANPVRLIYEAGASSSSLYKERINASWGDFGSGFPFHEIKLYP